MSKHRSTSRHRHREKPSAAQPAARATKSAVRKPAPQRPVPGWFAATVRHGLWITLAAALLTHLIHWLLVRANDPLYAQTMKGLDMNTYWTWAQKIVGGDLWSKEFTYGQPFYYGPLYPYYLSVIFKIFGESYDAVHGLQALWGLIPPLLVFGTTRRLFGPGAALAAGLFTAFCAPIFFYEQLLLMEGLLVLIHAGVLWSLVRGQTGGRRAWVWAAAAGALSAVACWGRGNFLLAIPLLGAAWVVAPFLLKWTPIEKKDKEEKSKEQTGKDEKETGGEERKDAESGKKEERTQNDIQVEGAGLRRWRQKRAFLCAAAYLVGASLFLAMPLARNIAVSGKAVITTSNGPILLYIGNAHDSLGVFSYTESYEALVKQYGDQAKVPWKEELLRDIVAHPGAFLGHALEKTWMFWNSYDVADNISYTLNQQFSWLFRWSPVYWGTLVPLALVGIWHTRRTWRMQLFLYVYAVGFALSIIAVFVVGRYRLEEVLPMLVWSGAAVAALVRWGWERQWNWLAIHLVLVAAGVGILWPTLSPAARLNTPPDLPPALDTGVQLIRPNDYNTTAIAYVRQDRNAEAIALLRDAVRAYPWYDVVVTRLASLYMQSGRPDQGATLLDNFARTMGARPDIVLQLAQAEILAGQEEKARAHLESILQVDPTNADARALLATLKKRP